MSDCDAGCVYALALCLVSGLIVVAAAWGLYALAGWLL